MTDDTRCGNMPRDEYLAWMNKRLSEYVQERGQTIHRLERLLRKRNRKSASQHRALHRTIKPRGR